MWVGKGGKLVDTFTALDENRMKHWTCRERREEEE